MTDRADIMVIGAGMAGASVAAHLAQTRKVIVLEMEDRPGHHSTGRSAAAYEPNYGPEPIRALTRAARGFFHAPPNGFTKAPLVTPRETVFLVPDDQREAAARLLSEGQGLVEISQDEVSARLPLFRRGYARFALLDAGTADIDVDLLHQAYLRMMKAAGGRLVCNAPAQSIERADGVWRVATPSGSFISPILVNAAGAWGDELAKLAGVPPIGLQPKRRSIAIVPPPGGHDVMTWPLVGDAGETWYAKPAGGKLLVSPADAVPVEPHDAFADDMTLAEGIARFQEAVDFEITRIDGNWGGLRSFAPDGNPVCGYDPKAEGFFWLIGQGGYGIQTAPALSRVAAALVEGRAVPEYISREGFDAAQVSPARF